MAMHAMLGNSRSDMDQYGGMAIDLWLATRQHTHIQRHTMRHQQIVFTNTHTH